MPVVGVKKRPAELSLQRREDGWWILDPDRPYTVDGQTYRDYGPYDTRAEAESDRQGLTRFFSKG